MMLRAKQGQRHALVLAISAKFSQIKLKGPAVVWWHCIGKMDILAWRVSEHVPNSDSIFVWQNAQSRNILPVSIAGCWYIWMAAARNCLGRRWKTETQPCPPHLATNITGHHRPGNLIVLPRSKPRGKLSFCLGTLCIFFESVWYIVGLVVVRSVETCQSEFAKAALIPCFRYFYFLGYLDWVHGWGWIVCRCDLKADACQRL